MKPIDKGKFYSFNYKILPEDPTIEEPFDRLKRIRDTRVNVYTELLHAKLYTYSEAVGINSPLQSQLFSWQDAMFNEPKAPKIRLHRKYFKVYPEPEKGSLKALREFIMNNSRSEGRLSEGRLSNPHIFTNITY